VVVQVRAVVLAFNGGEALLRCLASLQESTSPGLETVVVDNASSDGSIEAVARRFPHLRVLANGRNLGFGAGCNVGIRDALEDGAELVLLVNQDALVSPELVTRLVDFAREHPRAGVVGPKTLSTQPMPDGRPRRLYAGSWRHRLALRQTIPGIERADTDEPAQPLRTDYVWGHGMLLRAAALREVGLFDPAYFMYFEDLDLCRRMHAAGWEVWVEPRAVMWHETADGARAEASEAWRWRCKVHSAGVFHRGAHGRLVAGLLTCLYALDEAWMLARTGRRRAAGHLLGAYLSSLLGRGGPQPPPAPRPSTGAARQRATG
jgi:GT2 family glycosyltransferase